MAFAKCARCGKFFDKIKSPVCLDCLPDEDADYEKIRDVLSEREDLCAQEVAEAAGVSVECVLRMMDDGQIVNVKDTEDVKCGRCGAPAISASKRLCQKCLEQLNREVSANVYQIQKNMDEQKEKFRSKLSQARARSFNVRNSLDQKRRPQRTGPVARRIR